MDAEALQFAPPEELASACREAVPPERVEALTEEIQVFDTQSIVTFGRGAAEETARAAEDVLRLIQTSQLSDPAPLLETLGRVMGGFDSAGLSGQPVRRGLFRKPQALSPDQILEKYRQMGEEVDRAYIAVKRYEAEIQSCDRKLKALFDAVFRTYGRLVECIRAGEQGCREIADHLRRMEEAVLRSPGGDALAMDRDSLRHALALLERRVQELRVGEVLALQSLPAIQTMRKSNLGLLHQIDAAFLVTLPVFRQALGQALVQKRRQLQNQAMEALNRRTRDALEAQGPAGSPEVMEEARNAILEGIAQLQALRQEAETQRKAEARRLNEELERRR